MVQLLDYKLKFSIVLALLFLLSLFKTSECLKCYVCNSVVNKSCSSSSLPQEFIIDCSGGAENFESDNGTETIKFLPSPLRNYTFCRKDYYTIPKQVNKNVTKEEETRVVRSCGWISEDGNKTTNCKIGSSSQVHSILCTCSTDLCNSASKFKPFYKNFTLMSIILFVLFKFN